MSDKKVKLKLLANIGAWKKDEVIEVDEVLAGHLLHVNETTDGITVTKHVRAMKLEDAVALEEAAKDISNLTQAEAAQLGIKNVVDSSPEASLDKAAADLKAQAEAELAAEEKAAKKGKK